jgi:hypothetical protein
MASQMLTQMQQSSPAAALPGTWKLAAGRAITLEPRESGVLRVAHGQIWATFDGPHAGPLNDLGDHVVGAGERLPLRAGQRLVVEAWNAAAPAYFNWDPLPTRATRTQTRITSVVQPLEDLRLALAFGAGAAGRLVMAVAALAWELLPGRAGESSAGRACNAQAKACSAHG